MANILPVSNMINHPNVLAAGQQGLQFGQQQRALREQRADQQQIRQLTPQIIAGDPAAYTQAASIDQAAADKLQGSGDAQLRRLEPAIALVKQAQKTNNPKAVQAAWDQVRPYLARLSGHEPPIDFATAAPHLDQLEMRIQMAKAGGGGQSNVQSTRIGADGYYYTVDRQGNWTNSGIKADPRVQFRDQPGIEPGFVNLREQTITPVQAGPAQVASASEGMTSVSIDGLPQEQQQRMAKTAEMMRQAGYPDEEIDAFVTAQLSRPRIVAQEGAAPIESNAAATRPAVSPAEEERLRLANEANQRAAEASQRAAEAAEAAKRGNAPAGFRFREDGSLEPIPGGPKPAGAAASEDERKAAAWLAQANNAFSNMQSVLGKDERADDPGFIETYVPWDEAANLSRSDTRQQYVQAASSLSEALLRAATGAGITIDEAKQKVRELTPQRGDSDAVKAQKMRAIPVYIEALRKRAGRAAPQGDQAASAQGGWSIQRVP